MSNSHTISTISSCSELAIATRTNTPVIPAPVEFQSEILQVATKYVKTYPCRFMSNDICGMMELVSIIKNRIENLTIEGLADGSILDPADVSNLLKGNAMMTPLEEKAIIGAYHNGVENASLYVHLFLSFKVYDFMKSSKFLGTNNEQDMYCSLQAYLYTLVEQFDFEKIKHGGLSTKYYRQAMLDYVRNVLIRENSLFSVRRRQASDLHRAQRISSHDSRTMSYEQLAKKYGITKNAVSMHFVIMNVIHLDSAAVNDDGESSSNYDYFADSRNDYAAVEVPIKYSQLFATLEREANIEEADAKSILASLLAYSEQSEKERGYIKKASQHVYKNIADEVGVPLSKVQTVIHTFSELFV